MAIEIDTDFYCVGRILYIYDYDFGPEWDTRHKYAIILGTDADRALILHCLPTSVERSHLEGRLRHGCNTVGNWTCYVFEANKVVGKEGFAFQSNTHVYFRSNFHITDYADLEIYNINDDVEDLGILSDQELSYFIECAMNSIFTPNNVKSWLASLQGNT